MFESTIELLDSYAQTLSRKGVSGFHAELAGEVRERLIQLDWIVKRVRELEAPGIALIARRDKRLESFKSELERDGLSLADRPLPEDLYFTKQEAAEMFKDDVEMKLLVEAFYYLAGRTRSLIRHKDEPLPGLRGFEAEGVRNVRNQLLEHPEGGSSRVFVLSWARGGPQGPVLKAMRYTGQEKIFPDAGLYANALEFRTALERVLRAVLKQYET